MPVDEQRLNAFLGKAVADLGAAVSAVLVSIGDELGFYKALAAGGPMTAAELAGRTATNERYVAEWLANQAAGGYIEYDSARKTFSLSPGGRSAWQTRAGLLTFQVRIWSCVICSTFAIGPSRTFEPGKAWSGESIIPAFSRAPSVSSAPPTTPIC